MHRHNDIRQSAGGFSADEFVGQSIDAHIESIWIDIDEINVGAAIQRTIGRRNECVRAGPQPATRPEPQSAAGDVQRRGGIANGYAVFGAASLRYRFFESGHRRPLRQPIGTQNFDNRRDIRVGNVLSAVWNKCHVRSNDGSTCSRS